MKLNVIIIGREEGGGGRLDKNDNKNHFVQAKPGSSDNSHRPHRLTLKKWDCKEISGIHRTI